MSSFSHPATNVKSFSSLELHRIEADYIENLRKQIYFLELETTYLYP